MEQKEYWLTYKKSLKKITSRKVKESARLRGIQISFEYKDDFKSHPFLENSKNSKRADKERRPQRTIQRRLERKIKRGDIDIQNKLDLHGFTRHEALAKLIDFVEKEQQKGNRYLLVITGKGRIEKPILRNSFPEWCSEIPKLAEKIFYFCEANQKHGGKGAWYLVLRKNKKIIS